MADVDRISDEEVILRHIPGDKDHLAEGPRVTSANFELRIDETGVSVSRLSITTAAQLMSRLGDPVKGSRIAGARVADVRALGLDVIPKPIPEDSGHSEIVSATGTLASRSLRRKLARLFTLIDHV